MNCRTHKWSNPALIDSPPKKEAYGKWFLVSSFVINATGTELLKVFPTLFSKKKQNSLEEFIVYKKAKHISHIKRLHALAQGSMDFTSPVESAIAHGAAYCARYASFRTEFVARTGPVGPVSDAC